ncbi:hypothetical protein ES703_115212 [subsurface metagenome]
MKVTIPKGKDSSITENITLELAKYTIFAGENNSGKSNLIKAIKDHDDFKSYNQIFVPAENIQPQDKEAKTKVVSTEFFKLLKLILKPVFDKEEILNGLVKKFNNLEEKKEFITTVNKTLKDFGVENHEFDVKISKEEFEESLIVKKTKGFVRDLYKTDVTEVDFENIGMGTRRLIVAALIRYYEEKKINEDEKVLIIFEEPEVYLHPKLKKGLYESLLRLSTERENTMVLITTHDPYFIELGRGQKIYRVFRDPNKKDATMVEPMESNGLLGYKSDSEINYLIFSIPSKTYFIELYETLLAEYETFLADSYFTNDYKEKDDEENEKRSKYSKLNQWIKTQDAEGKTKIEFVDEKKNNPKISKLRYKLAHPKEKMAGIPEEEINNRIKELKELLQVMRAKRK